MPKGGSVKAGGGGGKAASERIGRDASERAGNKSTSTPEGQAKRAAAQEANRLANERQAKSQAIDKLGFAQYTVKDEDVGALADFFGIKSWDTQIGRDEAGTYGKLDKDGKPGKRGDIETGFTAEFSPLGFVAGLIGGIPGAALAKAITAFSGFEDPKFSFMSDKNASKSVAERGDRDRAAERRQIAQTIQEETPIANEDKLADIVNSQLSKKINFFGMPDFTRLSNTFGTDFVFDPFPTDDGTV